MTTSSVLEQQHTNTTNHTTTAVTLKVNKRDNRVVDYDASRIAIAIKKAYLAVEGEQASTSNRVEDVARYLTSNITHQLAITHGNTGVVDIETIQNNVEFALMCAGEHAVARAYILYREERAKERQKEIENTKPTEPTIQVTLADGSQEPLDTDWLRAIATQACTQLENTDANALITEAKKNLFNGVKRENVFKALTLTARTYIEVEPNYTYVTARLLKQQLFEEVLNKLSIDYSTHSADLNDYYLQAFKEYITQGIDYELLNNNLTDFNLDKLAAAIQPERDQQFTYLSLQTLYDRYFIHHQGKRIALPQVFFMRVAMGLAHCEGDQRDEWAITFYNLLSSFDYMSSTPTLFNSGTRHPQLSSCFLTTIPDCLHGIYSAIKDNAMLSKFAGGIGNDWTAVRGIGAHIKGTNGQSLGVVPFLNVADATAVAVNQGGKRKGAVCAYLETWHIDIEEFLELRKNTGDDRRRTHDMNTANWVPDLFMKRVHEKSHWTLFSPDETPDLHDLYGAEFEKAYVAYEAKAKSGAIRSKTIPAIELWRKMLGLLFETGHPWLTFKDPCNIRSPQKHAGVIHSSNLCTEITLNTKSKAEEAEIAVCNLGSINLMNHLKDDMLDTDKLAKTTKVAIRMLDNVIDINYYTVDSARNSNFKHRPIGLGIMGFQDALHKLKISYASDAAVTFADQTMELISYHAINASVTLAEERGPYSSFEGSLWSQGILPIDSIGLLAETRGIYLNQNTDQTLNWAELRKRVTSIGMRNSNVMAIAPTATISNICGVSQSIEPTYQNLFVKSNLSGEFTVVNPHLAADLKALNLWDQVMVHDLKYYNGSIQNIERIPADIKERYKTAFEIEPKWLIEAASRRQKWIDQAQSLNLYIAKPSGKVLDKTYKLAWKSGLKTTYYLRSLAATSTEKATISDSALNAVNTQPSVKMCAIDDPECEACQ